VRGRVRPSATCLISETIPRILIKFGSEGEFNFDSCRSIITNSVKQSPSLEADNSSDAQEILCRVYKSPLLGSILSQWVVLKEYLYIILPRAPAPPR